MHDNSKKYKSPWLLAIALVLTAGRLPAQQTLQVATKTVEKTFPWRPGQSLRFDGEKATVQLTAGAGTEIRVVARLTAKHPERAGAERELGYWQYVAEKRGKTVYLRNYIALPAAGQKPTGNLSARYEITVPAGCAVSLNNRFGPVTVTGSGAPLSFVGEFSALTVENATGTLDLRSDFGDVTVRNSSPPRLDITANRGNVTLENCRAATATVTAKYNRVRVQGRTDAMRLRVRAENAEVELPTAPASGSHYDLRVRNGELQLPAGHRFRLSNQNGIQRAVSGGPGDAASFQVDVEAWYGSVSVH